MPSIALPVSLRGQLLSGTRTFSPASLFSANEPGVWFDPSDLTTLFTDPAGTTPVTTPGQTVGLMLDKSKGLALGAELVTNGTFDSGTTGWSAFNANTTISNVSNTLRQEIAGGIASDTVSIGFATVIGRTYRLSYEVVELGPGAGAAIVIVGTSAGGATGGVAPAARSTAGTVTAHFVATGTTYYLTAEARGAIGTFTRFDNISVRELAGNHATQATLAARPTYSIEPVGGRRNLLTWTEVFTDAIWLKFNPPTITSDDTAAPNGTVTADRVTAASTSKSAIYQTNSVSGSAARLSIYVKLGTARFLWMEPTSNTPTVWFDLQDGVVSSNTSGGTASITAVGTDGWYSCSVAVGTSGPNFSFGFSNASGSTNQTSGQYSWVWGAQLELGSTVTPYQRVTTQHDVTEAGVASVGYLYFDGAGDFMFTSTITPGINKAQVFSGVRKLGSGSNAGIIFETSAAAESNAGAFRFGRDSSGYEYFIGSGGTAYQQVLIDNSAFNSPVTNTLTGLFDISAPSVTVKANGAQVGQNTASQGTGNFLAYPLFIGARGNAGPPYTSPSLFYWGHLYSLITRFGPTLDAPTISNTETYVGEKTGIDIAKNISTTIYTRSGDTILDRANSTIERRAV